LALSGLPTDRFTFEGFPPRKSGERKTFFEQVATLPHTLVYFESPHRLAESLQDMSDVFGPDRKAAVCRELTKTYEEVRRGTLTELREYFSGEVLGEITVVVSGAEKSVEADPASALAALDVLTAAGVDRKLALAEVMQRYGISKRDLFDLQVAAKRNQPKP
jgi:16S rRNA (cytidine1402-2'-O)-methyltransferase